MKISKMKKVLDSRLHGNDNTNDFYIKRCLELARKGAGFVSPNPMVGCVIVKNGFEISEGYHKKFGASHAEVNAIELALKKGLDISGSVMYVNLEPCAHFGKTPPCVDKIIQNKIKKVVIGTKDPNSLVAGKGISKLSKNGVDVVCEILEKECKELNKFYFKNIKSGLPYITLKAAQTIDGKIALKNNQPIWISSMESMKLVHKLRSEYDAVLVGRKTVEIDNPQLTVRLVKGRNPYRIVIDKDLKININKKIFNDKFANRTIVITSKDALNKSSAKVKSLNKKGITFLEVRKEKNNSINLIEALSKLSKLGIASVLVEGGGFTYSEFLNQNLADELIIFISPKIFGKGLDTFDFAGKKELNFKEFKWESSGEDMVCNLRMNAELVSASRI